MIQQILNWLRNSKSVTEFTKKVATWFFSWMWINEGSNITIDKEPGGIIIHAYNTGGGDDGEQEIYTIKITSYDSENIYKCNIYDIYEGEELETDQTVYIYQFDETVIVPNGTWLMATKHKEDTNDPPDPPDSDPVWEDRYEAEYSNRIYSVKITSHDSGNSYKCKVYDRENGTELLEDQTLKIYNIDASLIIPENTWLLAFWNSNGEYEAEYEINISGLDNLAITDITNFDKYLIWDASENEYKKTGSDYRLKVSDDDTTPNYLEEKLTVNNSNCGIKLEVLNPAGDEEIEVSAKVRKSIEISNDYIQLKNDELNPGNDKYYGTNSGGVKGFHAIPGGGGGGYSGPFALSIASGTVSITAGHATLAYKVNTIASDTITADVGDYIWYKFDDLDSYTLEKGSTWPTQNEDYVYFILGKVSSTTVMDQYHYGDIQDNARAM